MTVRSAGDRPTEAGTPRPTERPGASHKFVVEIAPKYGMSDPAGTALLAHLPSIGVQGVHEIRVSALYEIAGPLTANQVTQLSRELLSDPITQDYRLGSSTPSAAFLVGPHWRVEVWLKPTVTDPVGESVCKAIRDMGLPPPDGVRTGAAYRILGRIGKNHVERILASLLANPVIHRSTTERL